jgi:pimeloyl-ACP methyl ester carboxylesterase
MTEAALMRAPSRHAVWHIAIWFAMCLVTATRAGAAAPLEGFVEANGVRLQYLDWGGTGPALILVHGLGDDPHAFDDLAPAFSGRFHVIAYARRGSGSSDARAPYDNVTLTEDLRGLMDALGIQQAALAGHSAGGNEITRMAAEYPTRVRGLVYLDSGYDWSDPDFRADFNARPKFERPASAMASFEAYRLYERSMTYAGLDDMRRVESYLRSKVVLQPGGGVQERIPKQVKDALYEALFANARRDYTRVHCPVLAIYPEHWYAADMLDPQRREQARAYDELWAPFKAKSIDRVRREIANVQVVHVPGAHSNFMLSSREQVVGLMRRFLSRLPV